MLAKQNTRHNIFSLTTDAFNFELKLVERYFLSDVHIFCLMFTAGERCMANFSILLSVITATTNHRFSSPLISSYAVDGF